MREALAAVAHVMWVHWMQYFLSQLGGSDDPAYWELSDDLVQRWRRQMNTLYSDLPEEEKESDRREADRMIDALRRWIRDG